MTLPARRNRSGEWTLDRRVRLGWLACLLLASSVGCASVKVRDSVVLNAIRDHREIREARNRPTDVLASVLKREGLLELAEKDPAAAATRLEDRLRTRPEVDGALALAELSYRAGLERQSKNPDEAIAWLRDAAALSSLSISEFKADKPDQAIQIHNRSVARMIRIAQDSGKHREGGWQKVLNDRGVVFESATQDLAPARFADLTLVEDIRVEGMQHIYKNDGLGVTLVAHRRVDPAASPDPSIASTPANYGSRPRPSSPRSEA